MSDVYGFRGGPSFSAARREDLFASAMERPMSLGSTFFDQGVGGAVSSYGIGTAYRDATVPQGNTSELSNLERAGRAAGQMLSPLGAIYGNVKRLMEDPQPSMTEEAYKASPYYRQSVPWDASMTEDRAAALATQWDTKAVRDFYAEKRPITSFFGNLAGQAIDPINYIPITGPAVRAAAIAKFGMVKGIAANAALDASLNTAIAGLATRETRRTFGDDVSWQATISEIATAALIGAAFGTVGGVLERRAGARAASARTETEQRLATLRTVQESRVALNEAIGGLANDGEIRLSPNATEPMARVQSDDLSLVPLDDPRFSPKLDVWQVRPNDVAGSIREFVGAVETPASRNMVLYLGEPSPASVARAASVGIDIGGYSRLMEAQRIVHALRQHGDITTEAPRGQLPVTADHIALVPEIVDSPDRIERSVGRDGLDALIYEKSIGDQIFYVETVRRGRKQIGFSTMYRRAGKSGSYPAGQAERIDGPVGTTGFAPEQNIAQATSDGKIEELTPSYVDPQEADVSVARPDPIPEGRVEAETRAAKADDYKALASQYRVDPETGKFDEEAEMRQLETEGRLTEEDAVEMEAADETYQDSAAYGEALRAAVGCLL